MRRVAVWELGRLGDPQAAGPLVNAIVTDPDWECRHYAIMALANVGGPEEAKLLRALLAGNYLSEDGTPPAGPIPVGLAEHLANDIEFSARCCAGELPRPAGMSASCGQWGITDSRSCDDPNSA